MPIYAYRCNDCSFEKDHLQKMSDAPIAACPSCGSTHYAKQVSAAGFQLKGSGWYATDFKGSSSGSSAKASASDSAPAPSCGGGCACH
ncbi:MAG: zinc ribbon domain-containing protein [Rhodocyclaceae bacterium]